MTSSLRRLVADDLSGAAEAAGVVHRHGYAAAVVLDGPASPGVTVVEDLNVRNAGAAAAERIAAAISAGRLPDYVKIDSQLRGPVTAFIAAAARVSTVVLAPGLPALGRTVVDGVPRLHDVPLSASPASAWRAEASDAPRRLEELVGDGLKIRHVSQHAVRSGAFADLVSRSPGGVVYIPDTTDAQDLDAIARAIRGAVGAVTPVGSSGLLAALLAAAPVAPSQLRPCLPLADKVVLVLGSLEPVVLRQRAALSEPIVAVTASPHDRPATLAGRIVDALNGPSRIVAVTAGPGEGPHDVNVAHLLGTATAGAVRGRPDIALCLIGGETARRTLDALGERSLAVYGEVHPGAVLSSASGERPVVTRPGSFGEHDSLDRIISTLLGDVPRVTTRKKDSL
ncbi:four-carbon acid sugar kinase family protein [Mycetocola sp. 2940]|uniref:four-carbon acid sugar kinase family protein n=1 Tax=Mycetocola sp. 2940 TaxID=3156452 RepID=UPI00339379D7